MVRREEGLHAGVGLLQVRERVHAAVRAGVEPQGDAARVQGRGAQVAQDDDRDREARQSVDRADCDWVGGGDHVREGDGLHPRDLEARRAHDLHLHGADPDHVRAAVQGLPSVPAVRRPDGGEAPVRRHARPRVSRVHRLLQGVQPGHDPPPHVLCGGEALSVSLVWILRKVVKKDDAFVSHHVHRSGMSCSLRRQGRCV